MQTAAAAPGFAVFNARVGAHAALGRPWLSPVIGVQNLFDTHWIRRIRRRERGWSNRGGDEVL